MVLHCPVLSRNQELESRRLRAIIRGRPCISPRVAARTLTIAKEETPDKLTIVQTLTTEGGARTMALAPKTQRFYTCTAQIAPEPASPPPAVGERRRPSYVPGTFHLLVYGTE